MSVYRERLLKLLASERHARSNGSRAEPIDFVEHIAVKDTAHEQPHENRGVLCVSVTAAVLKICQGEVTDLPQYPYYHAGNPHCTIGAPLEPYDCTAVQPCCTVCFAIAATMQSREETTRQPDHKISTRHASRNIYSYVCSKLPVTLSAATSHGLQLQAGLDNKNIRPASHSIML